VAWLNMPMQLTPEVQIPTISVETRWPGASPQEVEREIVQEQEEQLKGVEGVTKMSSEAADSLGKVILEFAVGTNMEEALLRVNSRLQQVPEYPEDADEPVISTSSASDSPIAWFIIGARLPEPEEFDSFLRKHPQLKDEIAKATARDDNPGIVLYRLRELATRHTEVRELLPPDVEIGTLRKFAEDNIESVLERVPGVSNANVIGGVDPELQVVVDPEKLAARQLTIGQVRAALRAQNVDTSAGDVWEGKRRYVIRTLNQFQSTEEVGQQLLATHGGAPVYVRDVAEVVLAYKKPTGFVRRFGQESIAINAVRETGANVLEVMEGLREETRKLNAGTLKQKGIVLAQVYDETEYIYSSISLVQENIFTGSALTMIVLMLFLHLNVRTLLFAPLVAATSLAAVYISPWFFVLTVGLIFAAGLWFARGALVIALAIPVSIIGTFLFLDGLGRSLNVISLAGMAFAVGMLVDNAVVVLENIYRHRQLGDAPALAAEKATKEVWGAIVASTLTTLAVFVPVVYVKEEAGQLFGDIALAISAAIGLSMIVAVTLIPTVSARLLTSVSDMGTLADEPASGTAHGTNGAPRHRERKHALIALLESLGERFVAFVVDINHWIQGSTPRRVATAAVIVVAALGLMWLLRPKVEYLPNGNRNLVLGIIMMPPAYNLDEMEQIGETVETALKPYWDVEPGSREAEALKYPVIADMFFVVMNRQVFIGLRSAEPERARELIPAVFELQRQPSMAGSFAVAFQTSLFARGLQGGRTIDVEISGPELPQLVQYGGQILGQVGGVLEPNVASPLARQTQARPIPSLDLSSPEVHVRPRLVQASELGVTAEELGYAVNALVDGAYVDDYYFGGDKIDLSIVGSPISARHTQDVKSLPIATPSGQLVPISAVADVSLNSGPEQINRRERQRAITIQVTPPPAMALQDAIQKINAQIVQPMRDSGQLKSEYIITLSGTADKLHDTWTALRGNVILALLITYLLMAALFESWSHPLVIILSVPLGAVGGILGLKFLNLYLMALGEPPQALDVLTMLGFVILIGTVVNNPILIVHQGLNHMREDGMAPGAAIIESVRTRIRPIFMTTITTLIGLTPLVLMPGAGSELYRGLGAVVLGGLAVSTLFTLVLVPSLFTLMLDLQGWLGGLIRRADERMQRPTPLAGERRPVLGPSRRETFAPEEPVRVE
jgi:HAE1 family hydrophobic/amphiphilic exporter-1